MELNDEALWYEDLSDVQKINMGNTDLCNQFLNGECLKKQDRELEKAEKSLHRIINDDRWKIKLYTNRHPHGGVDLLPALRVHKRFIHIGIFGKLLSISWP